MLYMASNITLNRSNIVNLDEGNNRFEYQFPIEQTFNESSTIALSHLNIYLSWYNITAQYGNNLFTYLFFDIDGNEASFDILIDDGFYSVDQIYKFITTELVKKGHFLEYLEPGPENQVQILYPIEIRTNEIYYKLGYVFATIGQIMDFGSGEVPYTNIFKIPTTWTPPVVISTMKLKMPTYGGMCKILGFSEGELVAPEILPSKHDFYNILSSKTPELMPSSSYILKCSLVNNEMNLDKTVLSVFTIPNNTGVGDLISNDGTPIYNLIQPGKYKRFTLEILDQQYRRLEIRDSNILINLSVIKSI